MNKLQTQFQLKDKTWGYIPHNGEGKGLFTGDPIPSNNAIKLLGEEGIQKVNSILKGVKKVKEIIYGVDSFKAGMHPDQFFTIIDNNTNFKNLQEIFLKQPVILCSTGIDDDHFHGDVDYVLKRENWKDVKKNIERYSDYIIHVLDDVKDEYDCFEAQKIVKGDSEAIQTVLGKSKND